MMAYESRPAEAAPEAPAKRSDRSLPPRWPWDEDVDPLRLSASEHGPYWSGWRRGYDEGFIRGRRDGWRERVDHEHRAWEPMARSIKAAGGPFALSFDELQRRRAQLPEGYVPRPVPTFEECMASWDQPQAVSA